MKQVALIVLILALAGCEGDMGPAGPEGPQGDQGPQGPAGVGTRVVYESDEKIPDHTGPDNPFCVEVPEIDLDDMPLVIVYTRQPQNEWSICSGYTSSYNPPVKGLWEMWDGRVCFHVPGRYYKIVVVK